MWATTKVLLLLLAAITVVTSAVEDCHFDQTKGRYISGHNIATHSGKSLEQCKTLCLKSPRCRSFDYDRKYKNCFLSNFTDEELPQAVRTSHTLDYYEKHCEQHQACDFERTAGKYISSHNIARHINSSLSRCKQLCLDNSACRSFDFDTNSFICYLSNYTKKDLPASFKSSTFLDYYEKRCQSPAPCRMTSTPDSFVLGNNYRYMSFTTLEKCKEACLKEDQCKSADYNKRGSICYLSKVTRRDVPNYYRRGSKNLVYLEKECPASRGPVSDQATCARVAELAAILVGSYLDLLPIAAFNQTPGATFNKSALLQRIIGVDLLNQQLMTKLVCLAAKAKSVRELYNISHPSNMRYSTFKVVYGVLKMYHRMLGGAAGLRKTLDALRDTNQALTQVGYPKLPLPVSQSAIETALYRLIDKHGEDFVKKAVPFIGQQLPNIRRQDVPDVAKAFKTADDLAELADLLEVSVFQLVQVMNALQMYNLPPSKQDHVFKAIEAGVEIMPLMERLGLFNLK